MDRAIQEVAAGYAGGAGYAAGGKAVAVPGLAGAGNNNNLILIVLIIIVICACSGNAGELACRGRRGRRRSRLGSGALLLILGAFLLTGNNGGRNVNTNVINVNALDEPADGGFLDL